MKKNFRGMTLAAMLLSASVSVQAGNHEYAEAEQASQAFVGDMAGRMVTDQAAIASPIRTYSPVTVGDMRLAAAIEQVSCTACDLPGCAGGCDSACDSGCGSKSGFADLINLCDKDGWIRAEGLIMFMQNRTAPALVTTADPDDLGILPDPILAPSATDSTQVVFGEELDGGVSGGIRFDVGRYLTKNFGVGGRFMWLSENGDDYSLSSDGLGFSIGRPYFDIPRANLGIAREVPWLSRRTTRSSPDKRDRFKPRLGQICFQRKPTLA